MDSAATLSFNDHLIPITLRTNSRARYLRIAVKPDSTVIVTLPKGLSYRYAEKFVQAKASWIWSKLAQYAARATNPSAIPKSSARDFAKYKEQARALVHIYITELNEHYNFQFGRVAIRNQKTRWGSCSKQGNLNFNYKIVFLPEDQARYLVAHELCHLAEFNHSPKFWQLVSQTIPNYKVLRKTLVSA